MEQNNPTQPRIPEMTALARMTGKVIVVTAGYGDIGRAVCRRFSEEGGTVVMTGRKNADEGSAIAKATWAGGGEIEYLCCDAGNRSSIEAMLQEVLRRHPRIDVVISNAAMVENAPFLDIRPDQWQAHLDLNLTGNFHVGQAAARIMVKQEPLKKPGCERGVRGKILFNSSWCQDLPWPEGCCYGVAKAGLALMTKAMAQELAVHGIRVNIVAPGIILAGLSRVCYETDPKFAPRATAAIPLREFGTPEHCADAFLFLASDESDYITGVSLLVDGGASLPRRD
ncbi:MAG: SDR family oxidoreductase [Candidatus Hydrogenedentes bacterium]|nr:SDR family oxidoreductase [Candidatus Hydrogenedentota bacterium]